VSIEAFRVSGSPILCGSYVGEGAAELHLRLLDDAGRTFKEGREHSGRPARTISGSFPSACLASRLGFREITSATGDAMSRRSTRRIAGVSYLGEPGAGVHAGSGYPRSQARAGHDHANGSRTAER
jgi:hypothetical protein